MPLFVCEKCGGIDNTAYGRYWTKDLPDLWKEDNRGMALCCECAPTHFKNGRLVHEYTDNESCKFGTWHNKFPKRYYKDLTKEERKSLINYNKEKFKKFE